MAQTAHGRLRTGVGLTSDENLPVTISRVALVGIAWFVIRELPELLVIIDDVAYMATGEDRDTAAELDLVPDVDEQVGDPPASDD